jgi:hypothetical protein
MMTIDTTKKTDTILAEKIEYLFFGITALLRYMVLFNLNGRVTTVLNKQQWTICFTNSQPALAI